MLDSFLFPAFTERNLWLQGPKADGRPGLGMDGEKEGGSTQDLCVDAVFMVGKSFFTTGCDAKHVVWLFFISADFFYTLPKSSLVAHSLSPTVR